MRLLVLGGTLFLGRHVVAAALAGGHEVTTFTRGRTNPGLHPDVEALTGDRDGGLDALRGRTWDGVIDTSGYVPRIVAGSAGLLRDSAERYVFVSSVSAYADHSRPFDETAPLATLDDPGTEDVGAAYGGLKAACEQVVDDAFGDRGTSVRAGLIVGPHDPTDRFTYWPVRVAEGGEILAPGSASRSVQFVDARDLAAWMVELARQGPGGPLNATGPAARLELGELLDRAAAVTGAECRFTWVDDETLLAAGVEPWTELPLWAPGPELEGLMEARVERALEAGLELRPLEATVLDTLAWAHEAGQQRPTLGRDHERRILAGYADSTRSVSATDQA
jgi:2'-hydroxyisoflavone reductase